MIYLSLIFNGHINLCDRILVDQRVARVVDSLSLKY